MVGAGMLASSASAADPAHFRTDYGMVFLEQHGDRVEGFYPDFTGIIRGRLEADGEWLHGVWMQPDSDRRCTRLHHGTPYWGTLGFRGLTRRRFEGFWAFCDDPPGSGGQWNGEQVDGDAIVPPSEAPRGDEIKVGLPVTKAGVR